MSDHSFNPFIAKKHGINEAIIVNSFIFWTRTNSSNDKNLHEDRYWCFGTPEYFSKFFPYFKPRLIKDIIKSCLDKDILIKGNFNKKGYDKTNWYSLSDSILTELNLDKTCLQPAPALIGRITSNGSDGLRPMDRTDYVQPIPVTKTVTKAVTKKTNNNKENPVFVFPDKESIKTHINTVLEKRGAFAEDDTVEQIVFYIGKDRDHGSVVKKINIALKKVREGKWNIPQGYKGITSQSIRAKEEKEHAEKKAQYRRDALAFKAVTQVVSSGKNHKRLADMIKDLSNSHA